MPNTSFIVSIALLRKNLFNPRIYADTIDTYGYDEQGRLFIIYTKEDAEKLLTKYLSLYSRHVEMDVNRVYTEVLKEISRIEKESGYGVNR